MAFCTLCEGFVAWLSLPKVLADLAKMDRSPYHQYCEFEEQYSHHTTICQSSRSCRRWLSAMSNDCEPNHARYSQKPQGVRSEARFRTSLHFRLRSISSTDGRDLLSRYLMFYEGEVTFAIQFEPYVLEDDLSSYSGRMPYVVTEHLGDYPLSAEPREIVLRWISDCAKDHDKCSNTTPSFFQRGFLTFGPEPSCLDPFLLDSTSHLSLIQGSSDTSLIGYATLSHCWEKPSCGQLITTSENLNRWKQGIPISALSKTFADAIEIARSLQQRYL